MKRKKLWKRLIAVAISGMMLAGTPSADVSAMELTEIEETEIQESTQTPEETEAVESTEVSEETEAQESTEVPEETEVQEESADTDWKAETDSTGNYDYEISDDGLTITRYIGSDTELDIPGTIDGYKVVAIGDSAFYGCSRLTSVTIPEGVTTIEQSAFYDCSGLTSVTIPEGVTTIENWAFWCCSSLKDITLPESVTTIGMSAFYGCSSLTSIIIPEGVTEIVGWTFNGCSSLTSIKIPESVTSIGQCAFFECSNLKSITIPKSVTTIERCLFYGCSSLTSITIPDGVTTIEDRAFKNCSSLTSIEIPKSVTTIEHGAFRFCSSLTSITLSESVTEIGTWAFHGCSSLTNITIPKNVTTIGEGAFYDCSSLTSITIPEGVTTIENSTFSECSSLTSITIPKSVTTIGTDALPQGVVIYGYSGSYAETYAKENGYDFVDVNAPKTKKISDCTITLAATSYTYNGKERKPSVTVKDGSTTLKKDTDYTVSYSKNTNAGKATVTVTGKGNYTGSAKVSFQIDAKKISGCTVSSVDDQYYTGNEIKPGVTVKDGSTTLTKGTDYTLAYSKNTKVGTATITIKGKGNYTGSTSVTFQIVKQASNVKAASAGYNSVKISWDKIKGVTGYKVYRSTKKDANYKLIKTIDKEKTTSYTDTGLTAGVTYYYKVTPYKSNKEGTASKIVSAKPVPAKATLTSVKNTAAKTATVEWKKVSGASGYEVYYSTSKDGEGGKVITVKNGSTTSYQHTKLSKGKTYYYKVRAYSTVKGKKVYGAYSAVTNVKITK
jgi:hypothetical protein